MNSDEKKINTTADCDTINRSIDRAIGYSPHVRATACSILRRGMSSIQASCGWKFSEVSIVPGLFIYNISNPHIGLNFRFDSENKAYSFLDKIFDEEPEILLRICYYNTFAEEYQQEFLKNYQ
jgi:hypothetical protein